ncbi:bifunctional enoyl-CoA hydratase/phosphate acetyltransferase [bacterium]|nr:bifunctional enoyl-CoA hydratase/phosphate acetyltransferase [bacterium]
MINNFRYFFDIVKAQKVKRKLVLAAAEDENAMESVQRAFNEEIIEPIFVGNKQKVYEIADKIQFDISKFEFISENEPIKSAQIAIQIIRDHRADILMKGFIQTSDYLRAILNKEQGIRGADLLSHISFFEIPAYHKVLAVSDVALIVKPTFDEKVSMIQNGVNLFHHLNIPNPKVAVLASIETVNPNMPACVDAAMLTMMNKRHQINGCIIDGPLAFDNSISKESAEHKGIKSEVAGDADFILVPNIEVGNALYKSFTYFGGATVAGVVLGAQVPVILTSRSDSERSKLASIVLAACY